MLSTKYDRLKDEEEKLLNQLEELDEEFEDFIFQHDNRVREIEDALEDIKVELETEESNA